MRNYQARNFLRDQMRLGDRVLIYHSNSDPNAIVGCAVVVRTGYPDHTARDPRSEYYDVKSTEENPIWYMVDIRLETVFERPITLEALRLVPELSQMELLRRGSRLSVQPVGADEFATIVKLAHGSDSSRGGAKPATKASQPKSRSAPSGKSRTATKSTGKGKPRR